MPTNQTSSQEIDEDDPIDILKTRFAKGEREITKEEYEANLKLLQAYNPHDHHRGIVTLSNRKQALVSINQQKKTI